MNKEPLRPITSSEVEELRENGAVCLRGLFDDGWVDLLRDAVAEVIDNPGPLWKQNAAGFFTSIYLWPTNEKFRKFETESPLGEIGARLLQSETIRLYEDHLLVKEPECQAPTPWHQDQTYFRADGDQFCSLWIALDPVTLQSGGVQYIKGSHRWGWFHPNIFSGDESASDFPPAPEIESKLDTFELLTWDLAPGDCTVHHGLTFHGGYGNSTHGTRRRGCSFRLAGDSARYAVRKKVEPIFEDPRLEHGDPLDSDVFPQIYGGSRARSALSTAAS